ncbi:hypothetical protein XENORESO_018674 [Xenotaenia resolanae]|uniref:Uncharacterized protein n=1 Tax=Xenotaenia resolanae TaxID=208358 RepID=A0ABV0WTV6_9TELE
MTFPPSRTCTGLKSGKVQLTSLQTPHILDTNCLGFYLQVGTTARYLQKPAATETGYFSDAHLTVKVHICPIDSESKVEHKSDYLFVCTNLANTADSDSHCSIML